LNNFDLWLASIPGMGPKTIFAMRRLTGLQEVFSEFLYTSGEQEIVRLVKRVSGNGRRAENFISSIIAAKRMEPARMAEELEMKNIHFVSCDEDIFPARLKEIEESFFGLFYIGTLPPDSTGSVGIIGTRKPTGYGMEQARRFAVELASRGINIVAGMARGIDGIAGMGAVDAGGFTTAVLGCGVDICYPKENINLYKAVCSTGCVLSEFPPGSQPVSSGFPQRNRVISGLSDLIIVIEAMEKSGTMITVDHALAQGKDVFALPGRVSDRSSAGCNYLIRQGAGIAICPEDILLYLESMGLHAPCQSVQESMGLHAPCRSVQESMGLHAPCQNVQESMGLHAPCRNVQDSLVHQNRSQKNDGNEVSSEWQNLVSLRKERAWSILANRQDKNLKMILGSNDQENMARQKKQKERMAELSKLQQQILECLDEVQPTTPEAVMAAMAGKEGFQITVQEAAGQLMLLAALGDVREVAAGCFVRC